MRQLKRRVTFVEYDDGSWTSNDTRYGPFDGNGAPFTYTRPTGLDLLRLASRLGHEVQQAYEHAEDATR